MVDSGGGGGGDQKTIFNNIKGLKKSHQWKLLTIKKGINWVESETIAYCLQICSSE